MFEIIAALIFFFIVIPMVFSIFGWLLVGIAESIGDDPIVWVFMIVGIIVFFIGVTS